MTAEGDIRIDNPTEAPTAAPTSIPPPAPPVAGSASNPGEVVPDGPIPPPAPAMAPVRVSDKTSPVPVKETCNKRTTKVRRFNLMDLSKRKLRNVQWIWKGYLPRGHVILWAGEGETGKSSIGCDLAARIFTGQDFPGGGKNLLGRPMECAIINAEDPTDESLLPRLSAAGMPEDRRGLIIPETIQCQERCNPGGELLADEEEEIVDLYHQAGAIEELADDNPDLVMVVIDPITAFLAGRDENSNKEVKQFITRLLRIARSKNLCIVLVSHWNKKKDLVKAMRVMGSAAWNHGPRMVFANERLSPDSGRDSDILFSCTKTNISLPPPSLVYRIKSAEVAGENGEKVETSRVAWDDEPYQPPVGKRGQPGNKNARLEVQDWLKSYLKSGGQDTASNICKAAKAQGYDWKRVQRAADDLKIEKLRDGKGWIWGWPVNGQPRPENGVEKDLSMGGV